MWHRGGSRRAPANRPSCCTRGSSQHRASLSKLRCWRSYAESPASMERPGVQWVIAPSTAVRYRARSCVRITSKYSRSANVSAIIRGCGRGHASLHHSTLSVSLARLRSRISILVPVWPLVLHMYCDLTFDISIGYTRATLT